MSGKDLMPVHTSSLASSARSRRNHEVVCPFYYWLNEPIHHFRTVTAVTVQEHNDLAIIRKRAQSRAKRPPISPLGLCYNASAGGCCNFSCAIGAAVINDDYLVSNLTRHVIDDFTNRLLFVKCGDD